MGTSVEPVRSGTHRVGDEERQKAAEILADHHASGRLDDETFENRLGAALTARTSRELGRLLVDLPISRSDDAEEREDEAAPSPEPDQGIRIPPRSGRRIAAGTLSLGVITVPGWCFATSAYYDGGLVFLSSVLTGVLALGVGCFLGHRTNRRHHSA